MEHNAGGVYDTPHSAAYSALKQCGRALGNGVQINLNALLSREKSKSRVINGIAHGLSDECMRGLALGGQFRVIQNVVDTRQIAQK
jgi:hypothetical protein